MEVKVNRIRDKKNKFTLGVVSIDGTPFCLSLERPWLENKRNVSCIPCNRYKAVRVDSPKFGSTWHIIDVPGRGEILFHKGNYVTDSRGCILLGDTKDRLYSKDGKLTGIAIGESRIAFDAFMEATKAEKELTVIITEVD